MRIASGENEPSSVMGGPRGFWLRAKTVLIAAVLVVVFASTAQGQAKAAPLVGAGNLPGCLLGALTDVRPYMKKFHATILRVVVSPGNYHGNSGEALPCISAARAEKYRVMVVIQWASWWPIKTDQWWFARELKLYGRYASAVGVGNEQEIVPPNTKPAQYVRVWRAVEPIVKRMAPWSLRVGGEISPWGLDDLAQELRLGLPGIQAISVHPYKFSFGYSVKQALQLARRYRLPLWCDEGLQEGPDSWPSLSRTIPLAGMHGAAMAAVWDRI
jgi:hypothetical protein